MNNIVEEEECSICDESLYQPMGDEVVIVREKGLKTLIKGSKLKGDNRWVDWEPLTEHKFHNKCRKRYTQTKFGPPRKKRNTNWTPYADVAEGEKINFPFKDNCFICTKELKLSSQIDHILKPGVREKIMKICNSENDNWSRSVKNVINSVPCLVEVGARYHTACMAKFESPLTATPPPTRGHVNYQLLRQTFNTLCHYLESAPDCPFLLSDLKKAVTNYHNNDEKLIKMLKEKYGEKIVVFRRPKKQPIVCFRHIIGEKLAEMIPSEKTPTRKEIDESVLQVAASILKTDIQTHNFHQKFGGGDNQMPHSLKYFINQLLNSSGKNLTEKNTFLRSFIDIIPPSDQNLDQKSLIDVKLIKKD